MGDLEVRIIAEDTGNYIEEEIDDVVNAAKELRKHIGFVDDRRDKRYVVKFHDILYYMPEEYEREHQVEVDYLFEDFCCLEYDNMNESAEEKGMPVEDMLHPMYVGSYQAFVVDIPEIREDNIAELAMRVYDEFPIYYKEYIKNYVDVVTALKDLENNYMEYWIDYLENGDLMPKKIIEEIKDKYHKDLERRKAK